ncbi:glycosyltransferase [Psychrobacter phenylpyruvicus]|uniref:UDP-D-galactose:(Glucosyl)lipopolysaccharide-1,6-D-galactosyltransferase n=1 Tax=Psychrobacter phenylpyruvicus TaxID=29432 RepID=A0A379LLP0_9GAMM|nr:glycosyltransferase [Psychrobacter phenylpyruvicus]SUD91025.1 UDP-D-galactose:(glucosyl)lipopolysaccharide-1,6-D-galactosyltransferase [Psychrobacter phenylpyruvicus]
MSVKNILIIIDSLAASGGEVACLNLAKGMLKLGFKVHVLYFYDKVELVVDSRVHTHLIDIQKYRILPKKIRYQVFAKKVDKYIQKNIGDVTLAISNLNQSDLIMSYSQIKNLAYVIHSTFSYANNMDINSQTLKPWLTPGHRDYNTIMFYQRIYSKHPCICVSKGVEEDFRKYFGDVTDIRTIYNAFDRDSIKLLADKFIPKESEYIIHVGSFYKVKAHDDLLKAYAKTSKKYSLMLIGKGKLLEEIKKLAYELGIEDKVLFMGFKSNPFPFIKNAKGLVLSSHYEGLGRVLVEAQVLEIPTISTDCPSGPREILPEKCLTPTNDIDSLSKKIEDLMQNPENYKSNFNEELLPENIARQYLEFMNV